MTTKFTEQMCEHLAVIEAAVRASSGGVPAGEELMCEVAAAACGALHAVREYMLETARLESLAA